MSSHGYKSLHLWDTPYSTQSVTFAGEHKYIATKPGRLEEKLR